jgi:hypothetical protein
VRLSRLGPRGHLQRVGVGRFGNFLRWRRRLLCMWVWRLCRRSLRLGLGWLSNVRRFLRRLEGG